MFPDKASVSVTGVSFAAEYAERLEHLPEPLVELVVVLHK